MKHTLLVGTYSDFGVYKLSFENGVLSFLGSDNSFENCSYLCSGDSSINYNVVEELKSSNCKNGFVLARNADLSIINRLETVGSSPCYIFLDKLRNLLYVSNYGDGSLNVFSLNNDKSLKKLIFSKSFTSHSRIHSSILSSDGNFLFITDLGANKLFAYKIDYKEDLFDLIYNFEYEFLEDTQPRHIVLNDNNIFLVTEDSCKLYHLEFSETLRF